MTRDEPCGLLEACGRLADYAAATFERTVAEAGQGPAEGSPAAIDADFAEERWLPTSGQWPLGATLPLLSAAHSVFAELGAIIAAAGGPVTAPPLCRFVVEHMAEALWILEPGTYDPTETSEDEVRGLAPAARRTRVRRAAVATYRWTIDFEKGQHRPGPNKDGPPVPPPNSSSELKQLLGIHLGYQGGTKPTNTLELATKLGKKWALDGEDATEPSMTKKVDGLARRITAEPAAHQPQLYSTLSTLAHPNPFVINEAGGSGTFERSAPEMARIMTVAAGALACGWRLIVTYAGWDHTGVHSFDQHLLDLVGQMEAERIA